jgi:hypothetical protein
MNPSIDFSGWSHEDFVRWLYKNHPKPTGFRYIEFTLNIQHTPELIFRCTMADDYETCIDELARELAIYNAAPATAELAKLPDEPWTLLVRPAKRRKKKQMMLWDKLK